MNAPDKVALVELAERVEDGERSDQHQLLTEAFEAIKGPIQTWRGGTVRYHAAWFAFEKMLKANAFESAATTLVPEGMGWLAGWGQTRPDEPMGGAIITPHARFAGFDNAQDPIATAEAATPALALTAAALRARAEQSA